MTLDRAQRALIDLGWISLIHRVLGTRPSGTYALFQLMRSAGRPVTFRDLAQGYADFHATGGVVGRNRGADGRGPLDGSSREAIGRRIMLVRAALADLGVVDAIHTLEGAYILGKADLPRVEAAILGAAGLLDEAAA